MCLSVKVKSELRAGLRLGFGMKWLMYRVKEKALQKKPCVCVCVCSSQRER